MYLCLFSALISIMLPGEGSHALSWHSGPQVTKRILYFMCSKPIPTQRCMGISDN